MNCQMKRGCFKGILIFILLFICLFPASAKIVPKVDNFVIFLDQSGSMYLTYENLNEVKMVLAKKLLLDINATVPELSYRCAVTLFAPWKEVLDSTSYRSIKVAEALNSVPDENEVFGRFTPMGDGINCLHAVLDRMPGKTAVILVSDGEANRGQDPVKVARETYSKYPNICFHVISFADNERKRSTLRQINQINNCVYAEAGDLLKDEGMLKQFVHDVFYEDLEETTGVIPESIIHFDFDSAIIKPASIPIVNKNVDLLRRYPKLSIVIEGHADFTGPEDYNLKLSLRRAETTYNYFIGQGITANRMKTIGFGEARPIADNRTSKGRALNRRVEMRAVR